MRLNINSFIDSNPISVRNEDNLSDYFLIDKQVSDLLKSYGGCSFSNGLFRIHSFETMQKWQRIVESSFGSYKGNFLLFGFDWAGRQFGKQIDNEVIYLFDINFDEVYKLETTISDFFNIDLVDFKEETINSNQFFNLKITLKFNEIAGLKTPLKLGGIASQENYEIIDSEVDWEINEQLKSL